MTRWKRVRNGAVRGAIIGAAISILAVRGAAGTAHTPIQILFGFIGGLTGAAAIGACIGLLPERRPQRPPTSEEPVQRREGLDWRDGLRRCARATGVVYLVIAVTCVGYDGFNHLTITKQHFALLRNGVNYDAMGFSQAEAERELDGYLAQHPQKTLTVTDLLKNAAEQSKTGPLTDQDVWGKPNATAEADPVAAYGPWDEYETRTDWSGASRNAAHLALGFACVYIVFWALFRTLRWIGLGFLEGPKPRRSQLAEMTEVP